MTFSDSASSVSGTTLITSAAYIGAELIAELGRLPPAFLPIANRRAFEHQHAWLSQVDRRILLSIPEDFVPPAHDAHLLSALNIQTVRVPPGLKLGESILFVINDTAAYHGDLRILHGDTIVGDVPLESTDAFAVGETEAYYPWAEYEEGAEGVRFHEGLTRAKHRPVVAGYFCFESSSLFAQSIARSRGSFLDALNRYSEKRLLSPLPSRRWYDLGHLHTYHRSRASLSTGRSFNDLSSKGHSIRKASSNKSKIKAEVQWYTDLPPQLRRFTPQVLGEYQETEAEAWYEVEYLHLVTLSDLYVFCSLPPASWERIFRSCSDWMETGRALSHASSLATPPSDGLYLPKTQRRLQSFAQQSGFDIHRALRYDGREVGSLSSIATASASLIAPAQNSDHTIAHGDFCFSNILFDFRADTVKTVDPRGAADRVGDVRYEIAKLHHSVVGNYDFILADRMVLEEDGRNFFLQFPETRSHAAAREIFLTTTFAGRTPDEAAAPAIAVQLFLSMLPLHSDSRQRQMAFIANALRLFEQLEV